MIMKFLSAVLMGGVITLFVFSCATVPKEPLPLGELRLLSMDVVGSGVEANTSFAVNVFFEAAGHLELKRACFYESREEQLCLDVSPDTLGGRRIFQVHLPGIGAGPHSVQCYAEYIRNGELRKTNVITTHISVGVK